MAAFWLELILTMGLVSVILGTASGASMYPARTFGPDLASRTFTGYWVYIAGPIAGAVLAVGIAFVLRGRAHPQDRHVSVLMSDLGTPPRPRSAIPHGTQRDGIRAIITGRTHEEGRPKPPGCAAKTAYSPARLHSARMVFLTHLHADPTGDLAGTLLYPWGVQAGDNGPLAPIRIYGPTLAGRGASS